MGSIRLQPRIAVRAGTHCRRCIYEKHNRTDGGCRHSLCGRSLWDGRMRKLDDRPQPEYRHEERDLDRSVRRSPRRCERVYAIRHAGRMHGSLSHHMASALGQHSAFGDDRSKPSGDCHQCRSSDIQRPPPLLFPGGRFSGPDERSRDKWLRLGSSVTPSSICNFPSPAALSDRSGGRRFAHERSRVEC